VCYLFLHLLFVAQQVEAKNAAAFKQLPTPSLVAVLHLLLLLLLPPDSNFHRVLRVCLQQVEAKKAKAAAFKQRALQAAQRAEASVKLGSLAAIMSTAAVGPLAVLATWHAAQQRIYVVTRHASGVRGRAVGTLVGYDKYLNLLLKDVEETYTVIVKVQRVKQQVMHQQQQQVVQQQQQQVVQQQQQQQQGESEGQQAPAVRTRTRWCRKQQHRHRQLDQILLKGDNIVLVSGTPPKLQLPVGAPP
jgi:small nuclear ribonucleoprotein (snRNP)-like protein